MFPEHKNDKRNIIRIPYNIHCRVHLILSQAYIIKEFVGPAIMMNKDSICEKSSKILSERQKQLHIDRPELREKQSISALKKYKDKPELKEILSSSQKQRFLDNPELCKLASNRETQKYIDNPELRIKKSKQFKNMWSNFSDEQYATICNNMSKGTIESMNNDPSIKKKQTESWILSWDVKKNDPVHYAEFCQGKSDQWTDEAKQNQSDRMVERWSDDKYKKAQIQKLTDRYNDKDYKDRHQKSSEKANKNIEKREDASRKIKAKWQDPVFRAKQLARKPKPARQIVITHLDGSESVEGMSAMIKKYNLNETLVYRFVNTDTIVNFDNAIKKGHAVTEKTKNTIGLKFKDMKNETN